MLISNGILLENFSLQYRLCVFDLLGIAVNIFLQAVFLQNRFAQFFVSIFLLNKIF